MKKLFDLITPQIVTSAGGILLAGALVYVLMKILGNEIPHLETAIRETAQVQVQVQQETNSVLRENAKAIEGNTKILESLERVIIQNGTHTR